MLYFLKSTSCSLSMCCKGCLMSRGASRPADTVLLCLQSHWWFDFVSDFRAIPWAARWTRLSFSVRSVLDEMMKLSALFSPRALRIKLQRWTSRPLGLYISVSLSFPPRWTGGFHRISSCVSERPLGCSSNFFSLVLLCLFLFWIPT